MNARAIAKTANLNPPEMDESSASPQAPTTANIGESTPSTATARDTFVARGRERQRSRQHHEPETRGLDKPRAAGCNLRSCSGRRPVVKASRKKAGRPGNTHSGKTSGEVDSTGNARKPRKTGGDVDTGKTNARTTADSKVDASKTGGANSGKISSGRPLTSAEWNAPEWKKAFEADYSGKYEGERERLRAECERLEADQGILGRTIAPSISLRTARHSLDLIDRDIRAHVADFERVRALLAPGSPARAELRRRLETEANCEHASDARNLLKMFDNANPRQLYDALNGMMTRVVKYHRGMGATTPYQLAGTMGFSYLQVVWQPQHLEALADHREP